MRHWGRLLGWSATMLGIGLVPLAVGWGRLPNLVASHWGIDGAPDGRLPLAVVPVILGALIAVGLLTTSLFRVEGEPTPEATAMVGLLGGLGTSLNGLLVYLNWDATTWDEAGVFEAWHIVVVLGGAFAGGLAGLVLGRRWYPVRTATRTDEPVIDVAPGERVSWVGRTSVRWPLFLIGAAVLAFVVLPEWGVWLGGLMVFLALALMQVEANVNNDGLRIRLGGIPVRHISLDRISSARSVKILTTPVPTVPNPITPTPIFCFFALTPHASRLTSFSEPF